jgi:hypothetical protein
MGHRFSLGPAGQRRLSALGRVHFLLRFTHSTREAFSLSGHRHVGPACWPSLSPSVLLSLTAPPLNPAAFDHVRRTTRHLKLPPPRLNPRVNHPP